jgi:hypothetical protein
MEEMRGFIYQNGDQDFETSIELFLIKEKIKPRRMACGGGYPALHVLDVRSPEEADRLWMIEGRSSVIDSGAYG